MLVEGHPVTDVEPHWVACVRIYRPLTAAHPAVHGEFHLGMIRKVSELLLARSTSEERSKAMELVRDVAAHFATIQSDAVRDVAAPPNPKVAFPIKSKASGGNLLTLHGSWARSSAQGKGVALLAHRP